MHKKKNLLKIYDNVAFKLAQCKDKLLNKPMVCVLFIKFALTFFT